MSRSFLFVPGDSLRKYERAKTSGADALIFDLEDSVARTQKESARRLVRQMLDGPMSAQQYWVRVNPLDSGLLLDDLAAVLPGRPYGIVLPKCSGASMLRQVAHYLDALEVAAGLIRSSTRILVIATETAPALFHLGDYAGVTERLWGLSWGAEDLAADLGALRNRVQGRYTEPYRQVRSMSLCAAAAANVRAIDTVCVAIDDPEGLRIEAEEAFCDGFVGKLAIHPRHIPAINDAFTPSPEQLAWAGKVVTAFTDNPGLGAFNLDGNMIDQPHLRLARRLLGEH